MLSLCTPFSRYRDLASVVDNLGFRNMLEGRIPKQFFDLRPISLAVASGNMQIALV
jgi:hypothetical protein